MKQVCILCARTAADNNLYCQEIACPAEMSPVILDYGEWLGDIEILKPIIILRSSVLYQARHGKKKVFLKVAHPGQEHIDRLKREATFLSTIESSKDRAPGLPTLLPPYANTIIEKDVYGKAMLKGHLLYFYLFEHFPGDPLRDILIKNPQLWIYHIGWLMFNLATTVAFLQSKGFFHLGLSPESILVNFDVNSTIPHVVLFDLGIATDAKGLRTHQTIAFTLPAYTAPELLSSAPLQPSYATDVYGLGLILYELLVGEPPFPFKLLSDKDVYDAVRNNPMVRMSRTADVEEVANIAIQAVSQAVDQRQQSAAALAEQILKIIGQPPAEKRGWRLSLNTTLAIVITLLALAFLITVALNIQSIGQALFAA